MPRVANYCPRRWWTVFVIRERFFPLAFAASHSVADARYFGNPVFAARHAELHGFAAKNFPTVEKTVKSSARLFTPCSRARVHAWDESDGTRTPAAIALLERISPAEYCRETQAAIDKLLATAPN
jgi:hypothetical protein